MDFNASDASFAEAVQGREEAVLAMAAAHEKAESSVYGRVIKWTLMAATFLMPLLFLPWTSSVLELNKQLLMIIVGGVLLVSWLLSIVSSGQLTWRTSPFDKAILALGGAVLVASIFSINWYASIFGSASSSAFSFITILGFVIFYFVAFNSENDGGEKLADILSISVVAALIYGLLQIFGVHILGFFSFTSSHAFNTVGSVNALGIAAAISLPLFSRKSVNANWINYLNKAGFVAALAVLVILNWWVLWTVAIAGMVGLIAFGSLSQGRSMKQGLKKFLMPMTVIVLGVFFMIVNFSITAIKTNLPIEISPSFSLSNQVAQSELKEDLFTGSGPSQYSLIFDRYGASRLSDSSLFNARFQSGTSQLLTSVTEGGLVFVAALLLLLWALIQGVRAYVRDARSINQEGTNHTPAVWAMLIASGAAFALYPFSISIAFLAVAALTLAVLSLWGGRIKNYNIEDNVYLSLSSSLGFIGGLILVLAGVYFGLSGYIGDVKYAQALAKSDINNVSADLVSAINWNNQNDAYYRAASQAALTLLSQEVQKPVDSRDTQLVSRVNNYVTSAVNLAKQAIVVAPEESLNWANLGNIYQNLVGFVDGVDQLAEDAYNKAAELRPGDASFYYAIGNTFSAKADLYRQLAARNPSQAAVLNQTVASSLATAEVNYQKAIELSPNYGLAVYNLGNVYARQNKLGEAISQLERLTPFNSDQPNLLFQLGLLYFQNNQKDKAFTTMQQVLVLSPDYANAHWYMSLIYEERGDIPNAIAEVKKILAVEVNKDNQTVIDRITQLEAGSEDTGGPEPL